MKIFVTVGTKEYQFDRLVNAMDRKGVFIQTGSSVKPKKAGHVDFISKQEIYDKMNWADVVVCHAGVGTVMEAIDMGKRIVVVPRLSTYDEHVDDHQLVFANYLRERFGIEPLLDTSKIWEAVKKSVAAKGIKENKPLINSIKKKII